MFFGILSLRDSLQNWMCEVIILERVCPQENYEKTYFYNFTFWDFWND